MPEIKRAFLSGSYEGLAQSLKLKDLKELQNINEIELPDEVFADAKDAVRSTQSDFCERRIDFGFKEGSQVVKRRKVGNEFSLATNSAEVSVGCWESMSENFSGEPATIFFHTHPHLNKEYLERKNIQGFTINSKKISIEQGLLMWRNYIPYFSKDDIAYIATNSRYVRSALLASELGYLWIINVNLSIVNWLASGMNFPERKYARILRTADRALFKYIEDPLKNKENLDEYTYLRKQALIDFCKAYGFIVFSNDSFLTPVLKRLDEEK